MMSSPFYYALHYYADFLFEIIAYSLAVVHPLGIPLVPVPQEAEESFMNTPVPETPLTQLLVFPESPLVARQTIYFSEEQSRNIAE